MKAVSGFTLIELLVVILIVSILMGIGVPSFRYVTNANRLSAEVNGLLGDLQYARSEAIKEGQTVTVCPSTDGASCVANSSTWDRGWIVLATLAGTPTVLRVQQPFASTKDSFVSDQSVSAVTFNREGFAAATPVVATGFVTVKLTTLPNTQQWTRCVEVGIGGTLTTERYGQDSCQ